MNKRVSINYSNPQKHLLSSATQGMGFPVSVYKRKFPWADGQYSILNTTIFKLL